MAYDEMTNGQLLDTFRNASMAVGGCEGANAEYLTSIGQMRDEIIKRMRLGHRHQNFKSPIGSEIIEYIKPDAAVAEYRRGKYMAYLSRCLNSVWRSVEDIFDTKEEAEEALPHLRKTLEDSLCETITSQPSQPSPSNSPSSTAQSPERGT